MVQVSVGQCEACCAQAARLLRAVREIWEAATKSTVTLEQRRTSGSPPRNGIRVAAQIIDTLYNASGRHGRLPTAT